MNAYELADSLEAASSDMEYNYHVSDWKLLYESAIVLRKQADRIAELEKKKLNDLYVDGEIAGWIGYYEGKIATFLFRHEDMESFLENTDPVGKVRPVYTTPRINLKGIK